MSILLQSPRHTTGSQSRSIFGVSTGTLYIVNALGQVVVSDADAAYLIAQGWSPTSSGSGRNYAVIDFGAFPGSNVATTTIPSVSSADITALILAQVVPVATVDHSADEHAIDGPTISAIPDGAGNIVITGYASNNVPQTDVMMNWGQWSVAWAYL